MTIHELICADGSVIVSAREVPAVLAALERDTAYRMRTNGGGALSPGVVRVLYALSAARAGTRGSADRTDSGETATLEVTVADAAKQMQCSPVWVRRLCRTGKVSARRVGTVWLVDAASLDAYRKGTT